MIVATVAADDAVQRARVLQPPTPRCVDLNVHGLTLHAGLRGAAPRVAVNAYELNAVNPERLHTILQKSMSLPKVLRADAGKLCRGKTSARGAAVVAFASDGVREVLLDATHVRWWRAGW